MTCQRLGKQVRRVERCGDAARSLRPCQRPSASGERPFPLSPSRPPPNPPPPPLWQSGSHHFLSRARGVTSLKITDMSRVSGWGPRGRPSFGGREL